MKDNDIDTFKSLFRMFSFDLENLLNLPCHVFWKNIKGVYLNYNDYGALNLGYNSGKEISGNTDLEIFPYETASIYRSNDQQVVHKKKQIFAREKGMLKNNTQIIFLSHKIPLYDESEFVVGVLGLSFVHKIKTSLKDSSSSTTKSLVLPTSKQLSEREETCIQLLCQGLTAKQIARQLKISFKTVETYIERIKVKLGCHNKAELIVNFLKNHGVNESFGE